ncbi:sugar transport protein 8-like [Lycium ferocissimum]|uniref:sugar transport protein 8-like n=1 Tax=Lycium ferocissimum TaxID=112874 RepID=UPI0028167D09|nr:sugar transport protein 8-like [Lycium ferocissimum]
MSAEKNNSKITIYVFSCWILAAFGGLMFGYDIGISGGVSGMDDFLIKFFPNVHERKKHVKENNYCKYDDQYLQLFTSSLYLAALVASFFASKAATKLGRRVTMLMASIVFIAGAGLSAAANNKVMLIFGRILFGIGVGFGNETVPLFLTEVAPIQHRGAVNILFQLFVTIGIFIANLVNFATSKSHPNGWRLSLGFAAIPAAVLLIGCFVITDTPTSLVARGHEEKGKAALKKLRGVSEVEVEYQEIVMAVEQAKQVKNAYRNLAKPASIPPLVISIWLQIFQQFTGINAIMFYAPVLFQTMGFKTSSSLLSAVMTGLVNVASTFVAIFVVDKVGRKKLLLQACCQMLISQVAIGSILAKHLSATGSLEGTLAIIVVLLVCTFVMAFAWSWGPLGWLIPSETFPLETRTAGFAFAVSTNMLFTAAVAQAFLTILCTMQAYTFFFFSAWIVVMGIFAIFFLPETKGIPIDAMVERAWMQHPIWKKLF